MHDNAKNVKREEVMRALQEHRPTERVAGQLTTFREHTTDRGT